MMRSILTFILSISIVVIHGQSGPIAQFKMNDCMLTNEVSNVEGALFGGNLCGCGVQSNGISFDGIFTEATFDTELTDTYQGDWSMTFYVRLENSGSETVDIFFLGENCGRDSVFSFRYFAAADRFRVRLSDSPNNEVQLDGQADPNTCWQYIGIVNQGSILRLYINGTLAAEGSAISPQRLNVDANLTIGSSPCLDVPVSPDSKIRGRIDQLKIYDRPLSQAEVVADDMKPDQIVSGDTTIFIGTTIQLRTGGSCSNDFTWSPTTFLDDPNSLNPLVTPTETTTYTLDINDDSCNATDQIRVNVVSREELSCGDLLLPNAFTPNNDNINDTYGISNKFIVEEIKSFEIFNKWGGRVFFTDQVDGTWDGVYKGETVSASSYVYLVSYTCEGQEYSKSGTLHVLR